MIILPDRNIPQAKVLLPIPDNQWRTPSQAVPYDDLGNLGRQTRFRVRARLNDGHVVWCGWFDDRADLDQFLWSIATGELWRDPYVQRLPVPWWPGLDPAIGYDFATVTFLTTTGSNQTYTSPADWNNTNNSIECLGSGASGGSVSTPGGHGTGGGGAAYSEIVQFNFAVPGTTTATYRVGASVSGGAGAAGTAGNPSWFNNASDPGAGSDNTKCSAKGGGAGAAGTGSRSGGAAGDDTNSWGQTKFPGGSGGDLTGASGNGGSGAGGAAGPNGAGGNGTNSTSTGTGVFTSGGTGDNGSGGAGGTGGGAGSAGTEWDATHGSGGGASGRAGAGAQTALTSGNYGAGGAGTGSTGGVATGGTGTQGIIVVTYTPFVGVSSIGWLPFYDMRGRRITIVGY